MFKSIALLPRTIFALPIFLLCATPEAFACRRNAPFDIASIDTAEVIFRGRIVKYEPFHVKWNSANKTYHTVAKMTFDVHKIHKGDQSVRTIEVMLWRMLSGEVPEELAQFIELYGRDFLVGMRKSSFRSHVFPPLDSSIMNLREVIQDPCRPSFMFAYDNGSLTADMDELEEAFRARGMLE